MPHFSGVIPPVVSPLTADGLFDSAAMTQVVEHLLEGGVAGVFALGTTGEGPSLSYRQRYEIIDRVCEVVHGRVPVLCCVTDTSYAESLLLAVHAHSSGAAAIVAAAPFYFDVPPAALTDWFRRLADESPLPLLLYNMPSCVGTILSLDLVAELREHPNVIGIKDSGGDLRYFQQLCVQFRQPERFSVFMGPEELLADAVALGGDGGVCGGANLLPHVYSSLYSAALRKDAADIHRLHEIIHDLFATVYRDEQGRMKLIPGLKLAMELAGLCQRFTAPPLQPVSTQHAARIASAIQRLVSHSHTESVRF
ncbi:MAG: dihydrodipicolinate synthase family protein [Planctomycetaceae bacterium]